MRIILFLLVGAIFFAQPALISAQTKNSDYSTARVSEINSQQEIDTEGSTFYTQEVQVIDNGTGEVIQIQVGSQFQPLTETQLLEVGDRVLLVDQEVMPGETQKVISDIYRLPHLMWLAFGFFALVLVVSGLKGLLSTLGMFLSLGVLIGFVIPQILAGGNPILISLLGAGMIGALTVYLSHGWNVRSHIALVSILSTLFVVTLLSYWYVLLTKLVGLGSEEAYFLQFGPTATINLQGLLVGGIMLGALGVLDDICISQVSIVFELKRANQKLGLQKLYESGMRVGRDHVASLVNTLVLAYAGANFPLFLLFVLNDQVPTWVSLNSQLLAEEIVRTLVGSIGLVLSVPLTTALSAYFAQNIKKSNLGEETHFHENLAKNKTKS